MTAITLYRTDPTRNMARYYRLEVQPDLFGDWCVVREWGRIGHAGQMRCTPCPTLADAAAAVSYQRRVKERRGYCAALAGGAVDRHG